MRKELTISELDAEFIELLPERETLHIGGNWAAVYATNTSVALNAASYQSAAWSSAAQYVSINQG